MYLNIFINNGDIFVSNLFIPNDKIKLRTKEYWTILQQWPQSNSCHLASSVVQASARGEASSLEIESGWGGPQGPTCTMTQGILHKHGADPSTLGTSYRNLPKNRDISHYSDSKEDWDQGSMEVAEETEENRGQVWREEEVVKLESEKCGQEVWHHPVDQMELQYTERTRQRNASYVTMQPIKQAIWGLVWKHTVEKRQRNATSATMYPSRQAVWGYIWKYVANKTRQTCGQNPPNFRTKLA